MSPGSARKPWQQPCVEGAENLVTYKGHMEYPTGIGTSDATSIHLLGHDLAGELIGTIGFGELARRAVAEQRAAGRFIPGLGHPVHKTVDPRTAVIIEIAEQEGLRGPHLRLFEAIGRVHAEVLGRTLPLNGAGVGGAALADIGLPPELLRGVALLARAAGLLGHIAEELRHPIAPAIYSAIDRNAVYRPTASNDITEQR